MVGRLMVQSLENRASQSGTHLTTLKLISASQGDQWNLIESEFSPSVDSTVCRTIHSFFSVFTTLISSERLLPN